jgi:hypothetical protein
VQVREYIDADWPSVWPIFREVVAAGDTSAYDPGWTSEQARDVWVVDPPGLTVVACEGPPTVQPRLRDLWPTFRDCLTPDIFRRFLPGTPVNKRPR